MKTNYYKAVGVLILWTVFIANTNINLTILEQLIVGMGIWLVSQVEELEE